MKRTVGNCQNDCGGWQECYNFSSQPEEPLKTALETEQEKCPFCGEETYYVREPKR